MAFPHGGGGGKSPIIIPNEQFALSKPGDLTDLNNPSQMGLLNQMLLELYESHRLLYDQLVTANVFTGGSGGDFSGPDGAIADNFVSFDGVTGKLGKDSGYSATSILAASAIQVATLTLSEADLESLGTSKITIVAAQGANIAIVPLQLAAELTLTANYTNNPTMHVEYEGNTVDLTGSMTLAFNAGAPKTRFAMTGSATVTFADDFDPTNIALQVQLSAALTGSGAGTAKVACWYGLVLL